MTVVFGVKQGRGGVLSGAVMCRAASHVVREYSDSDSGSDSDVPEARSLPASPMQHRRSGITIDLVNAASAARAEADAGAAEGGAAAAKAGAQSSAVSVRRVRRHPQWLLHSILSPAAVSAMPSVSIQCCLAAYHQ